MNRVETAFYNLAGIRPESEAIKWYSVAVFEAFAKIDWLLHRTIYEGQLPESGPMLLVANHTSAWDIAKGFRVGQRSQRIVRTFTKAALLDPTAEESEEVRARTGHKKDLLNRAPIWFKHLLAAIPNGVEALPVARGGGRRGLQDFRARGRASLEKGHLTAVFILETREKSGRIVHPMRGPEVLARDNPDIPIYPLGFAIKPHRASVGQPFTYNQMLQDPNYGELARSHFTVLLCDQIADQLPSSIRQDWYEDQRQQVIDRRKSS